MLLTKLDAAKKQLETACYLYINNDDILSIHTLAGAAEEILDVLAKNLGEKNIFERMKESSKEVLGQALDSKQLSEIINISRNQLKRANDPTESTFEYKEHHSIGMLFRALIISYPLGIYHPQWNRR